MPVLPWSEELEVGLPAMDETHREFVELLARARTIDDHALQDAWQLLIDHTETHFAQEEAWMQASHFKSCDCHSRQHDMILRVMREGAVRAAQGDITPVRLMTRELAVWFPEHTRTMDASLVAHLQRVGFDPATGAMSTPLEQPHGEIACCGGADCSSALLNAVA